MRLRVLRLTWLSMAIALAAAAVPTVANAGPQCLCRYQGTFFKQGQCVCMRFGGSERMACCQQVLNNSSWSFRPGGCKVASSASKRGVGMTPVPKGVYERRLKQSALNDRGPRR